LKKFVLEEDNDFGKRRMVPPSGGLVAESEENGLGQRGLDGQSGAWMFLRGRIAQSEKIRYQWMGCFSKG